MSKISVKQMAVYAVDELEKGLPSQQVSRKLASFLLANRQSRDAAKLLRAIEVELEKRGQTQVHITSAIEVSSSVKQELARLLGAKNPVFSETVDPRVIGGVRAEAGETVIDLTIQSKLQQFKATIARSQA